MTIKPSIFDGVNVKSEIQRVELLAVENASQKEYCENPEDIKNSDTVKKIISIVSRKANYTLDSKPENSNLNEIYDRFTKNLPITLKQLNYFKAFLSDINLNNEAQKIVSKLLILVWKNNSDFINSFLKDSEWNFIIDNFINYLSEKIENYNLIVDIDVDDIIYLMSSEKEWDYYTYKSKWKTWIFIVSNWKIFMLKKLFEDINLLNNWLIFCRVNNKDSEIIELGSNWFSWLLYDFDWNDFKLMEKLPWTIEVRNTQKEDIFITSANLIWYWLSEISKWEIEPGKLWVEITELLWPSYNSIKFQWNFILASRKFSESEYISEIYVITYKWIELAHTAKTNWNVWLNDLWNNYYLIETVYWKGIYKLDDDNILNSFNNTLLNMNHLNIYSLMKWEPTLVNNNNESWIYIFDKITWKLTKLIDTTNINLNSPEMDWDMMTLNSEYWEETFFYKNWKLYDFKKWFTLHKWYLKKWFFGEKIILKNSFEYMEPYLTEIKTPIRLKAK